MKDITLNIDGQKVLAKSGMTVLEAARSAGIYIPTLCHHPDLKPYGGCRLCIVEIEGMRGQPTSCTTPVVDSMKVHTETDALNSTRRLVVELLLAEHPFECLTCSANQYCELQKVAAYLGFTELRLPKTDRKFPLDNSNPFFTLDRNKCILCARCTRTCNEITAVGAIDMANRGYAMKVATFQDGNLIDSVCQSCGECVAHCPTGALAPKVQVHPLAEVATTCTYCGVGCGMIVGTRAGKVVSIRGNPKGTNSGYLCVKGRYGIAEYVHHPDRLKTPLIRKNGKLEPTGWDEALTLVANKLQSYSPQEVAVIPSSRTSNEDVYVAQKLARAVLRTNNVDNCARVGHAPSVAGLATTFGSGAMTNSIGDIGEAACILAVGTNTTSAHPVFGFRVKQAVQHGTRLIVINPREIRLCKYADIWLRLRPGTDIPLLKGIMWIILENGLQDASFIEQRCENFDAFKASLDEFTLDKVEEVTGVPQAQMMKAAWLYATSKPSSIIYTLGITEHTHGTDGVMSLANLAMLTGNIGKPGSGVNPLRGQNNVQGACDMGALPGNFPGYQAVDNPEICQKFEKAWGCHLNPVPGKGLTDIYAAAYSKEIKAAYIIGEDPVLSEPDMHHTIKSLQNLDFLVIQEIFLSETAKLAHVVLPAAGFAADDGTFTNTERRVQRIRKAVEPPGEAKPDWQITCLVAQKLGARGFDYTHPSQIWDEMASLTPSMAGICYARIEEKGLQWPCPTMEHPGTPILHTKIFTRGRGKFMPVSYRPSAELPDANYPLVLTTERSIYHYHTGTMTRRVAGLNVLRGEELVEINPEDANNLGIADGDRVTVYSRRGQVSAKAKVTEDSPQGLVSMTFHFVESPTNALTNNALDPISRTPELKYCAVRVEKSK